MNSNSDDASDHFLSAKRLSYEATFMLNWSTVGGNWSNKVKIYGQNLKLKLEVKVNAHGKKRVEFIPGRCV